MSRPASERIPLSQGATPKYSVSPSHIGVSYAKRRDLKADEKLSDLMKKSSTESYPEASEENNLTFGLSTLGETRDELSVALGPSALSQNIKSSQKFLRLVLQLSKSQLPFGAKPFSTDPETRRKMMGKGFQETLAKFMESFRKREYRRQKSLLFVTMRRKARAQLGLEPGEKKKNANRQAAAFRRRRDGNGKFQGLSGKPTPPPIFKIIRPGEASPA